MDEVALMRLGWVSRSVRFLGMGVLLQIIRDLVDFVLLKAEKFPLNVHIDGNVISGYFRHRSFLHHVSSGNYEPFATELFKKHVGPGMTVIDGGAHVGFYTLLAARLVGANGRVFSFEPDPYNFQCLVFNVEKNKYQNVSVIKKIISDKVGNAILYQSSGTISSSLGNRKEIRNLFQGNSVRKVMMESTTLDAELDGISVDVIKLDIEGAEPLALQGMSKIIQQDRPLVLFAEINPSALYSLGTSPEVLISSLKSLGFDIHFINELGKELVQVNGKTPIRKGNLYCKRGV